MKYYLFSLVTKHSNGNNGFGRASGTATKYLDIPAMEKALSEKFKYEALIYSFQEISKEEYDCLNRPTAEKE